VAIWHLDKRSTDVAEEIEKGKWKKKGKEIERVGKKTEGGIEI